MTSLVPEGTFFSAHHTEKCSYIFSVEMTRRQKQKSEAEKALPFGEIKDQFCLQKSHNVALLAKCHVTTSIVSTYPPTIPQEELVSLEEQHFS